MNDYREYEYREYRVRPIGFVKNSREKLPVQPVFAEEDYTARIELFPEYVKGLYRLEEFSHIIVVMYFHRSSDYSLIVKPHFDDRLRGVFATRSPRRPNPIAISTVKLEKIEGNVLFVRNLDAYDGTPVLDIKPHSPLVDCPEVSKDEVSKHIAKVSKQKQEDT